MSKDYVLPRCPADHDRRWLQARRFTATEAEVEAFTEKVSILIESTSMTDTQARQAAYVEMFGPVKPSPEETALRPC